MLPIATVTLEIDSAPSGLRDRKKQLVRAAITDAALGLFARNGFDETTLVDIAEAAGVSPATVPRYFPSKEAMLFAQRDDRIAALRTAILQRPRRESPMTAVIEALAAQGEIDDEGRARLVLSRQAVARSAVLRGRASSLLDEWRRGIASAVVERGDIDSDDAQVLATVIVAIVDHVAAIWAEDGGKTDIRSEIRQSFDALERSRRRTP